MRTTSAEAAPDRLSYNTANDEQLAARDNPRRRREPCDEHEDEDRHRHTASRSGSATASAG